MGWGSSPLTRGALLYRLSAGPRPRIIPAYAGSTLVESDLKLPHRRIIPAYAGSTLNYLV